MNTDYTVIIPIKDGERFILESLESIYTQTLPPATVLLVDDASTDNGINKAVKYFPQIQIVMNLGRGQYAALNTGLQIVQTPFVSFLDVDDIWITEKQDFQLQQFKKIGKLDICCSGVTNFIETENGRNERDFLNSKQLGASTFRTEVFKGRKFAENTKFAIFDWWIHHGNNLRVMQTGRVHLMRRIHDTNVWKQNRSEGLSAIMKTLRNKIHDK